MTNTAAAQGDLASHAAREALHEIRERRRIQDARRRSRLRVVSSTLVLYAAVAAIATSASGDGASLTAGVMLSFGMLFCFIAGAVDYSSSECWKDGPDIEFLKHPPEDCTTPRSVDLMLVEHHERDHEANAGHLRWITAFVAIQVVAILVVSTLVAGRLLANNMDSVDTTEALTADHPAPSCCFAQRRDPSGLSSMNLYAIAPRGATAYAATTG